MRFGLKRGLMENMPLIKVGKLSELPDNSVMEVTVGEQCYAVCNVRGTLHALHGECLHQGGPLGQGQVADGRIICPWHAWEYDCRSGENIDDPTARVATYPVHAEGDDILLQVP